MEMGAQQKLWGTKRQYQEIMPTSQKKERKKKNTSQRARKTKINQAQN